MAAASGPFRGRFACLPPIRVDATIDRVDGGYSSAAERLTVAQDVVGSIPTIRPNLESINQANLSFSALNNVQSALERLQTFQGTYMVVS